ncbi:conserved hypothetical protein [Ricinus communis]|uniref:Zinc knuckle CX2CX4HX4C domain-containing protein n=1 Tax=Ricinus communis TaxID=3988 RepID=B9T0J2_RICCO|nr:conserved hypothetical protein [Ricinus communis]
MVLGYFQYERLPPFCFICGRMGNRDTLCKKLFKASNCKVERIYSINLRALDHCYQNRIGEKWLRNEQLKKEEVVSGAEGMRDMETDLFPSSVTNLKGKNNEMMMVNKLTKGPRIPMILMGGNKVNATLTKEGFSQNFIDVVATINNMPPFRLTSFYGILDHGRRKDSWNILYDLASSHLSLGFASRLQRYNSLLRKTG